MPGRTVHADPWITMKHIMMLMKRIVVSSCMLEDVPRSSRLLTIDERLLADDGLRNTGEPSARDLWRFRANGNHVVIRSKRYENTAYIIFNKALPTMCMASSQAHIENETQSSSRKKKMDKLPRRLREFGCRRKRREQTRSKLNVFTRLVADFEKTHPASISVHGSDAEAVVKLVECSDEELLKELIAEKILPASFDLGVDVSELVNRLGKFDITVVGMLAQKQSRENDCNIICSCDRYALRGGICQHTLFVSSLDIDGVRTHSRTFTFFDRTLV